MGVTPPFMILGEPMTDFGKGLTATRFASELSQVRFASRVKLALFSRPYEEGKDSVRTLRFDSMPLKREPIPNFRLGIGLGKT